MNQWKVCAVTSRQGKVREAVQTGGSPDRAVPCRSFDLSKQHGIPQPDRSLCRWFRTFRLCSVSFPCDLPRQGQTVILLIRSALHSARSKFRRGADKENPFHVCPGRPLPDPPKPDPFLLRFPCIYTGKAVLPFTIIFTGLFRSPLCRYRPVCQMQRSAAMLDPAA